MNWNYWLPWREYPQEDDKDSNYESRFIERCDHDWSEWETVQRILDPFSSKIERGHVIYATLVKQTRYCSLCGKRERQKRIEDENIAIEIDFEIDDDVSLKEALDEPDEEPGRIIINHNTEEPPFGVTD